MKWLLLVLVIALVLGALMLLRTRRPRRTDIRVDYRPDPRVAGGEAMSHLHRNQQNMGPGM